MKKLMPLLILFILLAACQPAPAGSSPAELVLTASFTSPPPTPTFIASPTSIPTETPSQTPTPEWEPSAEFLAQFGGTAYSLKDNQVLFSPDGGDKIPIASVENGKFVFNVNGQEISVDPKLATVPEAKWFLNGASEQIMAVNDEASTYWQYEFDLTTNKWVEKSLPEVSTNVNSPTKIEWNDIVSNRWATAVRQAIDSGKIPTFGPNVVISDWQYSPAFYQAYGLDGPSFAEQNLPYRGKPTTRPIMYAAFGQIEVSGFVHEMATIQVAEKGGDYGLYNVLEFGKRYGSLWSLQGDVVNSNVWLMPWTKSEGLGKGKFAMDEPVLYQWSYNILIDLQPATDEWVSNGVLESVLGRAAFFYLASSW